MVALIQKELRSVWWVVALAAIGDLWLLSVLTGQTHDATNTGEGISRESYALTQMTWMPWLGFQLSCVACAFGLLMSLDDGLRGTWGFALYRPMSRRVYIGVKLLVGSVLTLLLSLFPVVSYAVWASQPESLAAPFRWAFLQPGLEISGWSVLVFLGAFQSGVRPARWLWSRVWPGITPIVLGAWLWLGALERSMPDFVVPTVGQFALIGVVLAAMSVVSILSVVEERDFA
jgi:hypothetical protein